MKSEFESQKPLLGRKEAAIYITEKLGVGISHLTLETLASKGGGPVYCKIGRRVFHKRADLDSWINGRTSPPLRSTSHEAELKRTVS